MGPSSSLISLLTSTLSCSICMRRLQKKRCIISQRRREASVRCRRSRPVWSFLHGTRGQVVEHVEQASAALGFSAGHGSSRRERHDETDGSIRIGLRHRSGWKGERRPSASKEF